ncbi:MAG TPA: hypothetical protein VFS43_29750 [Polyangiaceae bacterium]|nr:hypothetical protein [Polyangiaceae bacterium]
MRKLIAGDRKHYRAFDASDASDASRGPSFKASGSLKRATRSGGSI